MERIHHFIKTYLKLTYFLILSGICLLFCGGCQETPNQSYIVNKEGQDKLIEEFGSMDTGILLAEQVHAPEQVEDRISLSEQQSIIINAPVKVPDGTSVPIYTVSSKVLDEAFLQQMAEVLFDGETHMVSPEELVIQVQNLQNMKALLEQHILIRENDLIENEARTDISEELKMTYAAAYSNELNLMQDELGQVELAIYQAEISEPDYLNRPADYSFREWNAKGTELDYSYQISRTYGERNGNYYFLEASKSQELSLITYHLEEAGSPIFQDLMPEDVNYYVTHSFSEDMKLQDISMMADNACDYSLEEARSLAVSTLKEMGFDNIQFKEGREVPISYNDRTVNIGYDFFGYRSWQDISESFYSPVRSVGGIQRRTADYVQVPDDTFVTNYGGWFLGENRIGLDYTLNYSEKYESLQPITKREIYYVRVTNYGVTDFVIVNPKETRGLQAENVLLMDFSQMMGYGRNLLSQLYVADDKEASKELLIDHIELHYAMMQSPYKSEEYTMIPVWDFMRKGDTVLTVNAIDGSNFDRIELH